MTNTFVQVDAFTDRAFAGNPAAIFITESACDENWMQAVAQEMNLSETVRRIPVIPYTAARFSEPVRV